MWYSVVFIAHSLPFRGGFVTMQSIQIVVFVAAAATTTITAKDDAVISLCAHCLCAMPFLLNFRFFPRASPQIRLRRNVVANGKGIHVTGVYAVTDWSICSSLSDWMRLSASHHSALNTSFTILAERIAIGLEFNLILFSPFHSTTHTNTTIFASTLSIGVHVYNCTVRFVLFFFLPSSSLQYFISISIFHSSVVVAWFLVANKVLSLHSQSQCARDVRTITTIQHIIHLAEPANWDMPRANSCDCHEKKKTRAISAANDMKSKQQHTQSVSSKFTSLISHIPPNISLVART